MSACLFCDCADVAKANPDPNAVVLLAVGAGAAIGLEGVREQLCEAHRGAWIKPALWLNEVLAANEARS